MAEKLLVEADRFRIEYRIGESRLVLLLFLYESVDSVERDSAVVSDDPSSAVSIGKSGDDVAFARRS